MRILMLLILLGCLASCITLESIEGAKTDNVLFPDLKDKSCIVTALNGTKEVTFQSKTNWRQTDDSNAYRFDYKLVESSEEGYVFIEEHSSRKIFFRNNITRLGQGHFSKDQKKRFAEMINEINSNIKSACSLSITFPSAKIVDR